MSVTSQVPGVYHRRVGDIVVTALCDGYLDTRYEIFRGITASQGEELMRSAFRISPPRISVNAYLIHSGPRIALVETGSGDSLGPTLGRVPENIKACGIDFSAIDTVLLTHMHPDHSNGLTDPDGNPIYKSAELALHTNEYYHWKDDGHMAAVTQRKRERYFLAARKQLGYYSEQVKLIQKGEVFPGVTAYPIPGHTPGHTAYIVASGKDSLIIWGDTVHVPDIQIPFPDVTLDFDSDELAAAAARRRLFEMVTTDGMLVAGMHLDFPGFGHLSRRGKGFEFHPEPWMPEL